VYTKGKCNECGKHREVRTASHFGGGSYKRPGRWYRSSICEECALRLIASLTPGHSSVSRWGIVTLRNAWGDLSS
jgi:hypothetical protein